MYCNQCGNIVSENALFCSFCGASTKPAAPVAPTPAPVEYSPVSEPVQSTVSAHISESIKPESVAEPITPVYTTEQVTPAPQPTPIQDEIKLNQPEKVKVEKYYTFGHIVFCLIVNAIIALAAGIFAGLYFSLI